MAAKPKTAPHTLAQALERLMGEFNMNPDQQDDLAEAVRRLNDYTALDNRAHSLVVRATLRTRISTLRFASRASACTADVKYFGDLADRWETHDHAR